jgi:hypothetical protein
MLDTVATKLGIWHNAVQEMIGCLNYGIICARWVTRLLTEDHKVQQRAITSEMLLRYRNDGDDFLLSIVTQQNLVFAILTLNQSSRILNGFAYIHQQNRN